jgi:hypothetical protein
MMQHSANYRPDVPAKRVSHSIGRTRASAPLPVALLILSFLAPSELSLFVADLRLPPHRLVLLALIPWALYKLATSPHIKIRLFDVAFLAFNAWTMYVYAYHAGASGFIYGGSVALESFGGYIVARVWVRDIETFFATLKFLLGCIVLAALIALPDALFRGTFTHDLLQSITGFVHPRGTEVRMGLNRAYGTFDHPIHYGAFCAALFALYWFAEPRAGTRYQRAALFGGATLLSVSAAPLLCIGLQCMMLIWDSVTRSSKMRLHLTIGAIVMAYLAASFVTSRSPIHVLVTSSTFDPWTAYYRLLIWEHGLNNVWDNVTMGIGLAEWERPQWMVASTVDAFWLVTAMRTGVPAFLLLCLSIFLIGRAVTKRTSASKDKELQRLALGWMISLIALCLIGATVHYWNVPHTYFYFVIGLGGWLADPKRAKKALANVHRRQVPPTYAHAAPLRPAPALRPIPLPSA